MGDRVLFQVKGTGEHSPVAYGHWCGSEAPQIVGRLASRMATRPNEVPYTFARLIQEMCNGDEGALSFGAWNADKVLTAADSHGDAGVVLIDVSASPLRCECLGGYLTAGPDGLPKVPT